MIEISAINLESLLIENLEKYTKIRTRLYETVFSETPSVLFLILTGRSKRHNHIFYPKIKKKKLFPAQYVFAFCAMHLGHAVILVVQDEISQNLHSGR